MAESVVERLRHQCEHRSGMTEYYAIDYAELEALLAAVEAANTFLEVPDQTNETIDALDLALRAVYAIPEEKSDAER